MDTNKHWSFLSESSDDENRHQLEIEWTLSAIANAIVAGTLPPDDAYAWGRIAASEARQLGSLVPVQVAA
jgi:hypothetical protein